MVLFSELSLIFCSILVVKGGDIRNEWEYGGPPLHAVSIQYHSNTENSVHYCTGSLITPKWVLTAASCFDNNDHDSAIYAILGTRKAKKFRKGEGQVRKIVQTDIHPCYKKGSLLCDIALLKLESEAVLNYYVQTISIPPKDTYIDFKPGLAYGWAPHQDESNKALSSVVTIYSDWVCSNFFNTSTVSNVYCVAKDRFEPGLCGGTPGIPISRWNEVTGLKYVAAIASHWPEDCEKPALFTSVVAYRDFIIEHIENDEYDDY